MKRDVFLKRAILVATSAGALIVAASVVPVRSDIGRDERYPALVSTSVVRCVLVDARFRAGVTSVDTLRLTTRRAFVPDSSWYEIWSVDDVMWRMRSWRRVGADSIDITSWDAWRLRVHRDFGSARSYRNAPAPLVARVRERFGGARPLSAEVRELPCPAVRSPSAS